MNALAAWITEECLSDAEVAQRLGVSTWTARQRRVALRLPPADKWARRFDEKHGKGTSDALKAMIAEGATQQAIADAFGFSKSYARQLKHKFRHDVAP